MLSLVAVIMFLFVTVFTLSYELQSSYFWQLSYCYHLQLSYS
jgi:hypothetical protein